MIQTSRNTVQHLSALRLLSPTSLRLLISLFAAWLSLVTPVAAEDTRIVADVLLSGGTIVDGSGAPGVIGDVALRGDKVVAVGKFDTSRVGLIIDCQGLVVTPGFIDLHNHSDSQMVDRLTRANVNFLTQGCTTIVTGNCGAGPIDVEAYFKKIDAEGVGTHVIHLLPHGSLRAQILGAVDRAPTAHELQKLTTLAEKAMRDGAWGMSTGLIYVPGTYSKTDELVEIAKVVAAHGGLYASHIRNEGLQLLESVNEAIEIGRQAKLPVHVSHFKASGPEAWGLVKRAADEIEKARQSGVVVTADQYPYIASSTSLEAMLLPSWARAGGQEALFKRLNDAEVGARIRDSILAELALREQAPIRIARYKAKPKWVGRSLTEIADLEQRPAVDIVLEITRDGGAAAVSFSMSEEDVRFVMQLPWVATASDGRAYLPDADRPHPRSYGTFSRKIGRYALKEEVVTLEQAVRSSSGLPADILKLTDRGYLKAGLVADVAVFDPKTFLDTGTFESPHQYSTGIRYVYVAGQPAIHAGVPTGTLAGKALRHPLIGKD